MQASRLNQGRKNIFWSAITTCSRVVVSFLVLSLIARHLSIADFGAFSFAYTLALLAYYLADLGLDQLIIRDGARKPEDLAQLVAASIAARMASSLVCFILLSAYLATGGLPDETTKAAKILAAATLISLMSQTFHSAFQSRQMFRQESNARVIEDLFLAASVVASLVWGGTLILYAILWLGSKALGLIYTLLVAFRERMLYRPSFVWPDIVALTRRSFSFYLLIFLAAATTSLDTVLLREFLPSHKDEQVAVYQTVIRIVMLAAIIPQIAMKGLLPLASKLSADAGKSSFTYLQPVNNILMTLGALSATFVAIFAAEITTIIFGPKYTIASAPFLSLMAATIFLRFGAAYNLFYTVEDRVYLRVWGSLSGIITLVILSAVMVPHHGILGTVIASIAAHITNWSVYLFGLYRLRVPILLGWNVHRAAFWCAGLALIAYLLRQVDPYLAGACSLIYVCVAIWATLPPAYRRIALPFSVRHHDR